MRYGRVSLRKLFGSAAREPDRRGLFSFQFSTFALVNMIKPHFALNLGVCHGSVPIYDVVCGVPMGSFLSRT
jgi:hypothetical protein